MGTSRQGIIFSQTLQNVFLVRRICLLLEKHTTRPKDQNFHLPDWAYLAAYQFSTVDFGTHSHQFEFIMTSGALSLYSINSFHLGNLSCESVIRHTRLGCFCHNDMRLTVPNSSSYFVVPLLLILSLFMSFDPPSAGRTSDGPQLY